MLLHGGPRRVLFEETVNVVVAKTFVDMEARTSREQCAFVRQSRSIGAMPLSHRTQFRIMTLVDEGQHTGTPSGGARDAFRQALVLEEAIETIEIGIRRRPSWP